MKRRRVKETSRLPWQAQVRAKLEEFDSAKHRGPRMAALNKLEPLFAGNGTLKEVLRKCLKLARRAERLKTE